MSSDDPFQYFSLDRRTATSADVKKAYAHRLKSTRPEDDPQGFMRLRAMLERGLSEVRWRELYGNDEDETGDDDDPYIELTEEAERYEAGEVVDEPDEADDSEPRERRLDRHPSITDRTHPIFSRPVIDEDEDPDAYEGDDEDTDALETDPAMIDGVVDDIIDLLTGPWGGAARKSLQQKLDAPDISGIDDYQELSARIREFLCDRSGFYIEGMKSPLRPPWLTPDIMDAFEAHFGWSRQASTMTWEQRQNSWVARLVHLAAETAAPPDQPTSASSYAIIKPSKPSTSWRDALIIVAVLFVVVRIAMLFFNA